MHKCKDNQKLVDFLVKKGRMSARDIMEELDIDEADILFAEQEGLIKRVSPPSNASSLPWFSRR